jgi:hypothetical protein
MIRRARLSVVLASVALLLAVGWLLSRLDTRTEVLSVPEPERVFRDVPAGEPLDVAFYVHNAGGETLRVVGFQPGCGMNCCFKWKASGPIDLPPKTSTPVVIEMTPARPGEFWIERDLFLADRDGVRPVPVRAAGHAVARP